MRVLMARPAALSPAELIFLPVESCSIAVPRALSFFIRLDCARDAAMLVLTTAMIGLLVSVYSEHFGLTSLPFFLSAVALITEVSVWRKSTLGDSGIFL